MRADGLCAFVLSLAFIAGCATERPGAEQGRARFPLPPCESPDQTHCVTRIFVSDEETGSRDLHRFPRRYLELWDTDVRAEECERLTRGSQAESLGDCLRRLASLSDYFNPGDRRPDNHLIGVALEGGGGKSAPFALGVLAGLHQFGLFTEKRVGAVASVSGGTYAASFLFNRLLDQYQNRPGAGDFDQWFRSCVPDAYGQSPYLVSLVGQGLPLCGELAPEQHTYGRFKDDFAFQGQVWQFPNVLFPDDANRLEKSPAGTLPLSVLSTGVLMGETGLSLPFQYVARGIFRWPFNSAPSKLAYMYGLDRQYGYSPQDWLHAGCTSEQEAQASAKRAQRGSLAGCTPMEKLRATLMGRQARSLAALGEASKNRGGPQWIIGTNTPGVASPVGWLSVFSRDPVRHQFELTPEGYGSGIHGYARVAPESLPRFFGAFDVSPEYMSILDAVATSSAFFDDEQSLYNQQPTRLAFAATQGLLNVTWFTEIRNFNAGPAGRAAQNALPWPFWAITATRPQTTPYIHLQDGANSENTGILPLLRRGYRTIVYSHGTADRTAEFADICHLKNQLEVDAAYFVHSPDLDAMAAPIPSRQRGDKPPRFVSYLDQLCSEQIDVSDRAAFDGNPARRGTARTQALAKLYCGRLGYPVGTGDRTEYEPGYRPCSEYAEKFASPQVTPSFAHNALPPRTFIPIPTLFFDRSSTPLKFFVYRGDALAYRQRSANYSDLISTIVSIAPAVSFEDLRGQLQRSAGGSELQIGSWAEYCRLSNEERKSLSVTSCFGPNARLFRAKTDIATRMSNPAIPCTAIAHILAHACASDHKPSFPQDGFVSKTWNSSYTDFASYFDLGRHQVWRACSEFGACSQTLRVAGEAAIP